VPVHGERIEEVIDAPSAGRRIMVAAGAPVNPARLA
jgi:hypothetical protein